VGRNIKINNIYSYYLPYLIFIIILSNQILNYFGIKYLYVVFMIIGIIGMLISGVEKSKNIKYLFIYQYVFILYLLFFIQIFVYNNIENSIRSLLVYTFIMIYWTIYFKKYGIVEFRYLMEKTIPLIYIIAIVGFVQYFYSPNLFGLLDGVSNGIDWAKNVPFTEYSLFFRASSLLGSPQVYGLFMVLSIIMILGRHKKKSSIFGIVFLVFAGVLSGNKLFILILLLYAIYVFINISLKKSLLILVAIFFSSIFMYNLVLNNTFDNIRVLDRIVSFDEILEQESEDSRIDRYVKIILNSNVVIGDGFGSKTATDENIKVAESYFFEIYAEVGIFGLLSFMLFLLISFMYAKTSLFHNIQIFMLLVILSMFVVHAFNSPIFFLVWGVLLSSYAKNKKASL
jgi:hypothetical protein